MDEIELLDPIGPDGKLDGNKRAAQKAASRARDEADLKSGSVSEAELRRRNDFFAGVDFSNVRIASVGGVPYRKLG